MDDQVVQNDNPAVVRCLKSLEEAKTDTEVFAALMIVTKLLKAETLDRRTCCKIYGSIGFDFIKRLAFATDTPDNCPSFMYKSVAFTLLASFCTEEEFVVHPDMFKFIDVFEEILLSNPVDTDEQFMVSDVVQCISLISNHETGRRELMSREIVPVLSRVILHEYFGHDEILDVLIRLAKHEPSECWSAHHDNLFDALQKVATEFRDDQNDRKFELCRMLLDLIFSFNESNADKNLTLKKDWSICVHKGISDILTSRISKEQRDPAIMLLSVMVDCVGIEWLIQSAEEGERKLVLVVAHLLCIEIRMSLETQSVEDVFKDALLLTSCYNVLEKIIITLVNGEDLLCLDRKQSCQLMSAMTGAFKAIIVFLDKIRVEWDGNESMRSNDASGFIIATFRVLCAWLAEETSIVREEVNQVLAFLIKLASDDFRRKQDSGDKCGVDVMRFFLAPLCHLTAEDDSRHIILSDNFHHTLVEYQMILWRKFTDSALHCDDVESALSTVCGIFMNIVVLDKDRVSNDELFHQIFRFTLTALPQLNNKRDHLVLRANLSVLGLLLMKHYAKRVDGYEMSVYKYLSATLKFLWDAHDVDDSRDHATLVINNDYRRVWDTIMELWFLGMQALSSILALIPWICDFILESGWTRHITETFSRVKKGAIDPNTKSTYEDFLCCLVNNQSHGQKFIRTLKECGAMKICRTHELSALQEQLSIG